MADRAKLNAEICFLTTALRFHREGQPEQSYKRSHPAMLTLHHVATLLTTGTPASVQGPDSDPNALRVVAVTANVAAEGLVRCILVTQNTRAGVSPQRARLQSLKPSSERTAEEILTQWGSSYLRCVLQLLPYHSFL